MKLVMSFRTLPPPLFAALTKITELTTFLTPTDEFAIPFRDLYEAASTSTDIAMQTRWIAKDQSMRRYVPGHDGACPNQSKLSNGHATDNDRACPKRGSIFDQSGRDFPIIGTFEFPIWCNRSRKEIIGKADMRSHKNSILQGHTFKNRYVVLDFHIGANAD